ncbi:hypothetical protein Tco_1147459 [Tanacetum coccineum]
MISSIPVGSSISPEGFLSSILLVVVIIVMVVIVIVRVVIIVVFIGIVVGVGVSSIFKPSFMIIGVPVGPVFLLGLLSLAIDAACTFRVEEMPSLISCWTAAKVMASVSDVDVLLGGILSTQDNAGYGMIYNDGDGDNDAYDDDRDDDDRDDDEREIIEEEDGEQIRFLGGNSSSGTKKYRGSNSSDGGNTRDGVKIAGEVIGSGGEIEFSEELKELLPDEAGK